jgi:hypothetical protein
MSLENTAIEDRLMANGYKTERIGNVVNVHDPIHSAVSGSSELVVTGWRLQEIRNIGQAWSFIEDRA